MKGAQCMAGAAAPGLGRRVMPARDDIDPSRVRRPSRQSTNSPITSSSVMSV
jgi:hypothetical protein